jgi:uncharacterized SAM-binding protein YcdF (DUF218 family)
MSDAHKYSEIFDYLSTPAPPTSPEAAVVFGRKDPLVAYAVGDLIVPGLVEIATITGGVGKDSKDILELGYRSEADYLHQQLQTDAKKRGYQLPRILLEENATNGAENARYSFNILKSEGASTNSLTAVAHATSALRLGESLKFEAEKQTDTPTIVHRVPSKYHFDPTNPVDREEAAAELLRIADWPAKGWLGPQTDVPENLVDFARDVHGDAPKPVKAWQSNILRLLPKKLRLNAIELAARHGRK